MKLLTDSYKQNYGGKVKLSGKCSGTFGLTKQIISELTGGNADVEFRKIDDTAKALVKEKLKQEYKENPEGYIINIGESVTVYADTDRAAMYAAYSLKAKYDDGIEMGLSYSYPAVPHRSVRIFLPPKSELSYFKKFVDMLVQLGYNAILLEIGGAMEFKHHPEINSTWAEYCKSMQEYNEKPYVASHGYKRIKNSVHTFNANGDIYSQDEMRNLASYCRERCIEIIPEVPSLTHSEYILISHPEFRECDDEPYASTACPSNPDFYKLVFELYDEVIDVFKPSILHIGHDEWWVMCVCDKCKDKDPAKLYADDVMMSYNYLKERGIRTMMWGDKLIRVMEQSGEVHGGAEKHLYNLKTDETINVLGEEVPKYDHHWFKASKEAIENGFHQIIRDTADCADMLPKDIIYVNWYYSIEPRFNDEYLKRGMDMIYGNCRPALLTGYKKRFEFGAQGFSISNWVETTEKGMQAYDALYNMGFGTVLAWDHSKDECDYEESMCEVMNELYTLRNRDILNGPRIEVVHTAADKWDMGDKYCNKPYYEDETLTMGEYVVEYEDGTKDRFPIMYRINIGTKTAKTSRWASSKNWSYVSDPHLTMIASVCDIEKTKEGVWYKTVFPIKENAVLCKFIPREGFENKVLVKSMNIIE